MILSKTYVIEDYIKFGFKNILFTNDYATNPMTINQTDNEITVHSAAAGGLNSQNLFKTNNNFELSYTLECNLPINGGLIFCLTNNGHTHSLGFESRKYYSQNKWDLKQDTAIVTNYFELNRISTFNIKLVRINSTTIEFYVDDSLIRTFNNLNWLSDDLQLCFESWSGDARDYHKVSNFKISQL